MSSNPPRVQYAMIALSFFAIVVSAAGVFVASQNVSVTSKILEYQTKVAQLLLEVSTESKSTVLLEERKTYHISKTHEDERDIITVAVWNIGHQTAQNVVIGVKLDPQNATLYNSSEPKKCRVYDCFNAPSNPVEFKAIEPNGFYSMRTTLDLFTVNIKNMNDIVDLVVTMSYFDSKNYQELEERYRIIVD